MSNAPDYLARDRELASRGVPICPRGGERDRVFLPGEHGVASVGVVPVGGLVVSYAWCDRCTGFVAALKPRPGRHAPDF